jgi:hypothetical protein
MWANSRRKAFGLDGPDVRVIHRPPRVVLICLSLCLDLLVLESFRKNHQIVIAKGILLHRIVQRVGKVSSVWWEKCR